MKISALLVMLVLGSQVIAATLDTARYGQARHLYYKGVRAAEMAACGNDDDKLRYIIISPDLAEDIYGMKTAGYDADVLKRGLVDGWLIIYICPAIFVNETIKNKIPLGIQILKTNVPRPDGFFRCLVMTPP